MSYSICESAVSSVTISVSNKSPVRLREAGGVEGGSGERGVAVEWRGYPFIPRSASKGVQAGEGPGHVGISEGAWLLQERPGCKNLVRESYREGI